MRLFAQSLLELGPIKFGIVTDIHYGTIGAYGNSPYDKVPQDGALKLQAAVDTFNKRNDLDFVICLGDFIDNGWLDGDHVLKPQAIINIEYIQNVFDNFNGNIYNTLGNHDPDRFTKTEYQGYTTMPDPYYYFDKKGVRFIILDSNYWCDDDSNENCSFNNSNFYPTYESTFYLPQNQEDWLSYTLLSAPGKCIVFIHEVPHDASGVAYFKIQNRAAIRSVLEASGKVIACFNGHEHGNFSITTNSIPYYTFDAMTRGNFPTNAYGVVEVKDDDTMEITGYGTQTSY